MALPSSTIRTGGQVVMEACAAAEVQAVFAIHGVQIDPIFQACADLGIRLVDVRHEVSAGFAAEAYARTTGRVGVAAVCPGPGFTNVLTSMANAQIDRTPVVYLVGSTPDTLQESNGLQVGLDHAALAAPLTKWSCRVQRADQLARLVARALRVAAAAPCGPVLLDVPADVLAAELPADQTAGLPPVVATPAHPDPAGLERCFDQLASAARPVLLVGHTPPDWARAALARFVATSGIPAFVNYGAIGALADDDPHYGGTLYQLARLPADARPDVALAVGVQFGFDTPALRDGGRGWGTTLLHIDAEPAEIGRFGPVAVGMVADPDMALEQLAERASLRTWSVPPDWSATVRASLTRTRIELDALPSDDSAPSGDAPPSDHARPSERSGVGAAGPDTGVRLHPYTAARAVSDLVAATGAVLIGDGAVCKHWLHDALRLPAGARYLTHGRFGCMGMGPGLAIGAAVATGRPVVCVTGDGAAGFALGEYEAIVRHRLPVTFVIMNNARWGASMGFQLRPGGPGRVVGTELSDADYDQVMAAFGGRGQRVSTLPALRRALAEAVGSDQPACINVSTSSQGVAPEVPLLNA